LGFDTETRPTFKKGDQHSVSLLQLSTRDEAFLFRLNYFGFPEELVSLLADPDILKVGVAILDDIRALRKLRKFDAGGFVELSNIGSELGIVTCGLRNLAAIFFGVRISKKEQLTNWERPDLNSSQCLYAATDAWICLKMFRFLKKEKVLPEKIVWKMPEPQPPKSLRRFRKKKREQGN
jgi:ribonuclease D